MVLGSIASVLIFAFFVAWIMTDNQKKGEDYLTEKGEETKECDHDVCYECKHLIKKGSGQKVTEIGLTTRYMGYSSYGRSKVVEVIFCDLHKKPYDKFDSVEWANYQDRPQIFQKKIDPWKRVNEDGTDYVEPKPEVEFKHTASVPMGKTSGPSQSERAELSTEDRKELAAKQID